MCAFKYVYMYVQIGMETSCSCRFTPRSAELRQVFGVDIQTLRPSLGAQDSVLCTGRGAFSLMPDTKNLT